MLTRSDDFRLQICRKYLNLNHAPDTARTCNLQFRRLSLYPVELRVLFTEPLTIGHNVILARRKAFAVARFTVSRSAGARSSGFGVCSSLRAAGGVTGPPRSPDAEPKFIPTFVLSALQLMKILFSCEDFSEKSFASLINRARARGAISPTYSAFGWWA